MTSRLLSAEFKTSLATAVALYEGNLEAVAGALDFLEARGIPLSVAREYRLGVVPSVDPLHGDDYPGWLAIPYITRAGVVSLKFRNLREGGPKYIGPYDSRLYNTLAMDEADRTGTLGVCEGEMDALVATALCGIPSVGIPGVDSYKAHREWKELFRGYQRVLVFKDNDPDQQKPDGEVFNPGSSLARAIVRDVDTAVIVRLPNKDVNETYLAGGRDAVRNAAGL